MNCCINLVTDWKPKFFFQGIKVCVAVLLIIIWPIFLVELGHLRKHYSFIWKFQVPENSWTQTHRHIEILNVPIATFSIVYLIHAYLFRLSDPILIAYFLRVIILSLNTVLQYCFTLHSIKYNKRQNLHLLQFSGVRDWSLHFTNSQCKQLRSM